MSSEHTTSMIYMEEGFTSYAIGKPLAKTQIFTKCLSTSSKNLLSGGLGPILLGTYEPKIYLTKYSMLLRKEEWDQTNIVHIPWHLSCCDM